MTTLIELTSRVAQTLADSGNNIWDTSWLTEGIRQTLHEYSAVQPVHTSTTLTIPSTSRELDISTVTGWLSITEVWVPYTIAQPEHPPHSRPFELWRNMQTLYFGNYELQSGDTARLFYTQLHTLNGLDGATTTTVSPGDVSLLVTGAAGHVALSRSLDLTEQITLDRLTSEQILRWGADKLRQFRAGLERLKQAAALGSSPFVTLPPLDRYDI